MLQEPSARWKAQKLAILESLLTKLERHFRTFQVLYFLAFGFICQGILRNHFGDPTLSKIDVTLVRMSVESLKSIVPAAIVMMIAMRSMRIRISKVG